MAELESQEFVSVHDENQFESAKSSKVIRFPMLETSGMHSQGGAHAVPHCIGQCAQRLNLQFTTAL